MNLESALAELKKFKGVMEPESWTVLHDALIMNHNSYTTPFVNGSASQLEHGKDCGCKVCNGVEIYVKKYELPEKFSIGLHSASQAKINEIIDYLKAKENAK